MRKNVNLKEVSPMEFYGKYKGYDDYNGMEFQQKNGKLFYIRDGDMGLKRGKDYKVIAYDFDIGSYGDAVVINDYDIVGITMFEIQKDVQIPGTDIILEVGDKIIVLEEEADEKK